jgi:glucose/arabinose dehydrogenase
MYARALLINLMIIVLACISCTSNNDNGVNSPEPPSSSQGLPVPTLIRTDFMTLLQSPWDLAFASDGSLFFTERCRGLSVRRPDGQVVRLFGTSGSASVAADFFCEGQSGMNGLALDPNFQTNQTVYVFMASNLIPNAPSNHVVRLQLNQDWTQVLHRTDIISDIPFKKNPSPWGDAGLHSGGRIRFGPDGFLYVTTGDNHNGQWPQNLNNLGGKVLRVDSNGEGAPGNHPPAGADARIFTYGHRNPQGLTFHPLTGQPVLCEHGPSHDDEITALQNGGNGGWDPKPEPGVSCADNYCGYISNKVDGTPTPMTDLGKFPDAMRPLLSNADSQGMGPCTFLIGPQWRAWNGVLVVGIMAAQRMDAVELNEPVTAATAVTTASLPAARMRSLVEGPDGALYVATDEGSIWRVTPQ